MYFSVKHASFSGFWDCFKTKCYSQCKGKKFVIIIILYIYIYIYVYMYSWFEDINVKNTKCFIG